MDVGDSQQEIVISWQLPLFMMKTQAGNPLAMQVSYRAINSAHTQWVVGARPLGHYTGPHGGHTGRGSVGISDGVGLSLRRGALVKPDCYPTGARRRGGMGGGQVECCDPLHA